MATFEVLKLADIPANTSLPDSEASLSLTSTANGKVEVTLEYNTVPFSSVLNRKSISCKAENEQVVITLPKCWIGQFSLNARSDPSAPSELKLAASKLKLLAPEAHIEWKNSVSEVSSAVFFLNGVRFLSDQGTAEVIKMGGYDVEFSLIGDFVSVGKQVEADWNTITTQAVVKDVSAEKIPEFDVIIENVCWLLSFGFGANVTCSRVDLFNLNGNRVRSTLRQPGASEKPFYVPLLLDQMQGEFKRYLESTVPLFRMKRDVYRLKSIIHTLTEVAAQSLVGVRALLLANILEIFRHSFASNVLVSKGQAISDGEQFYRLRGGKRIRLSFGQILDEFSASIGLSCWTPNRDRFIDFRNKIIHEGEILGASFEEQHQNMLDVLHFCQCCVLALVDWDQGGGRYIPANEDPNTVTDTIVGNSATKSLGVNLKQFRR